jgi:hypothetical protein
MAQITYSLLVLYSFMVLLGFTCVVYNQAIHSLCVLALPLWSHHRDDAPCY